MDFSSKKIRKDFIKFFEDKEHKFVRSAPVMPIDDPTLLFTNAGMNQFKDIFLGKTIPDHKRAVNSQKCIRVSGKHNDLEEVGVDHYHHTFFEMLGNWSFGDYYKKDAIIWSWELFTDIWKLDKNRLWVTVYKDDDEAEELWKENTDIDPSRVLKFGDKDNFWEMGEVGPCGPCSEIHYFIGDINDQDSKGVNKDADYRELWNLVFMQYNRKSDGSLEELEFKHVDTGLGLERIVATLNKIDDHYQTDLFIKIINEVINISGKKYSYKDGVPHRVIADHLRMISFSLSDGIMPSNEGQGYVVRRVLRRAARFGRVLGIENEFIYKLVEKLIEVLGEAYPELIDKKIHIQKVIKSEEESFGRTLDKGLKLFEEICTKNDSLIKGEDVFKLYDTYGFPVDLTELLAHEKNMKVEKNKFKELMQNQKDLGRQHNRFKAEDSELSWNALNKCDSTSLFEGYKKEELNAKIILFRNIDSEKSEIILDKTPFYAESGGQVGDVGRLENSNFSFIVENTYKVGQNICHYGYVEKGDIADQKNNKVKAKINAENRNKIKLNHTATHLLHKSLKNILGEHVQQAGSLVEANRLRFDLTHYQKISKEEIEKIELSVNTIIRNNVKLDITLKDFDIAKKEGAEALFGEKYDDEVRVVDVVGFSKELCGGTHVKRTGDIGAFKIIQESSLASGIRRIEAITGESAFNYLNKNDKIINELKLNLQCKSNELVEKITFLQKAVKKSHDIQQELNILKAESKIENLFSKKNNIDGIQVIFDKLSIELNPQLLADIVRNKLSSKGIALISVEAEKSQLLCVVTKDICNAINAGEIIKKIASSFGLGGGGAKHFAITTFNNKKILNDSMKIGKDIIIQKCKDYDN